MGHAETKLQDAPHAKTVSMDEYWMPFTPNRDATLMIDGRTADWTRFEPELYNVLNDPREERNLAAERPELAKELRASMDRWWRVPE